MEPHGDILALLKPTCPTWTLPTYDYAIEVAPLRPLSFDRVIEGKAPVSETLLFKVPVEITGHILEYLPWSSLASLALTCRDFRQLARSRQFASINLNYSDNSLALIKKLVAEVAIRAGSYGNSDYISQSLGVCIRRITMATHPGWIALRHNIPTGDEFLSLRERTRAQRLAVASKHFFDCYLRDIRFLLSSRTALPHLELLDWRDGITLPRSFFQCLPFTSIQHLRLSGVKIDEELEIELPKTSGSWPLRTLFLQIQPSLSECLETDGPSTHPICPNILRLCASTLESLTWEAFSEKERYSFATYKMDSMPQFPRLRSLSLRFLAFSDYSVLDALLEGDVRELEINLAQDSLCSDFFEKRGTMPALKTLAWRGKIKSDQSLTFLRENSQLSKLSLRSEAPGAFLEGQLLPLLTKSFRHLTSLSLKWEDDSIPASALDAINLLTTLQQLHLSAGNQLGWTRTWLIDHALMKSKLKNLTSLRRMAFSRDTYDNGIEWSCPSVSNRSQMALPEQG